MHCPSKLVPSNHHWKLFRRLRAELSLSEFMNSVDVNRTQLADICNVSVGTVDRWKAGKSEPNWYHRFLMWLFYKILITR